MDSSPTRTSETPYPSVSSKPDYPRLEERVLAYWGKEGIFRESVEGRDSSREFVFYDGPPFANGLPHYGHLLTGYIKDIIPRYQTMLGKRVERRFGWDCHGLPAEMEVEKKLGISGRLKILEYGVDRFNQHCRETVDKYTGQWRDFVSRQARWVDMDNDYRTLDLPFMESVLWAFKSLWDKGLVYESFRVMPYSWAAETPVSNFETRLDDSYRERQDPAITVRFRLEPAEGDPGPIDIWVWTTTPWTLPSNLALAVGPEIAYGLYERDGRFELVGEAVAEKYEKELEGARKIGVRQGSELVGRGYTPLFDFFAGHPGAFRVLAGDFVDTEEGTGVVHMAPGFGEDDQKVCAENDIEVVCPVDNSGKFTAEVPDWQGLNVFEANKPIIARLKERSILVRHETYLHNYPHCWRTDEPLIYKALNSWYVKVTDFRDRMVELNQEINWIPDHIRDGQFGKWLEGARDWSISRNRFWGAPIPVWRSDDPAYPRVDVYGSLDELERDFGVRPTDLHRPAIDQLTRPNPDDPTGKSMMRRVPEVLDCWFESGSMPYAQVHYPFENKEWFEEHFPADFIVEYIAQTRGWFYTLMVLSTALFDRPPFQNCICHGVVLDGDGRKLSKRLKNYPSPQEVFDSYGSDALRWFLCSSPILRGLDLRIDREGKAIGEIVRLVLNPIWNAYSFFTLYANADGIQASFRTDAKGVLDRYVLAKTRLLVESVQKSLDDYDLPGACNEVRSFLDALNNWYIRRSRPRFWKAEHDQDKRDAYDTLYTVLVTLCKVAAPLLPLLTEEVYRGLTGERSVHLSDWPQAAVLPRDAELVGDMDFVRQVCSAALGVRESHRLRTRLPLEFLVVASATGKEQRVDAFRELILDEINVKELKLIPDIKEYGEFQLKLNARVLGPRVGKSMKGLLGLARSGEWTLDESDRVVVGDRVLEDDEYEMVLKPAEGLEGQAVESLPGNEAIVVLHVEPGEALRLEGRARDVVRLVQEARKQADFHVSDRIRVSLQADETTVSALAQHEAYVMEHTLAEDLEVGAPPKGAYVHEGEVGEVSATVGVLRA